MNPSLIFILFAPCVFMVKPDTGRIFGIELYDEENSIDEDRFDTIGDASAGIVGIESTIIGNVDHRHTAIDAILFVVYTERIRVEDNGQTIDVVRLISARMATNFERGLYYGKLE